MAAVAGMDTALTARPFHQVMFISNVLQNYAKKYAIVNSAPRFFSNYAMAVSALMPTVGIPTESCLSAT